MYDIRDPWALSDGKPTESAAFCSAIIGRIYPLAFKYFIELMIMGGAWFFSYLL